MNCWKPLNNCPSVELNADINVVLGGMMGIMVSSCKIRRNAMILQDSPAIIKN
jgi:hypothetical protein